MAPLMKNPYDFYRLLTFRWYVSKLKPNRIQITVIQVKLLLQIFKTMEKSEFRVLIKHCFVMGKILFKPSNGLISVIQTLLRRKLRLRVGRLTLNSTVQTQMVLNAQVTRIRQLSRKTLKRLHKFALANHKLKLHEIARI